MLRFLAILGLSAFLVTLNAEESLPTESETPVPNLDAYDSWKMAKLESTSSATGAEAIQAPEGFSVQLIREASEDEGSWVSMAFNESGNLFLGIEEKGILKLTFKQESLNDPPAIAESLLVEDTLEECRGLLWAYNSLYANANRSKGFYRLQDTTGDGQLNSCKLLLNTAGGVGHGRNHLRLGPDGFIYLIHGNNPWIDPDDLTPTSPYRNWDEDQLIPNPWDDSWNQLPAPAGYILRTDKEGSFFERVCGGLRNALDMDFNQDGEMFVYDADSEWDSGLAWYRPTRVLHIVSGGEYGWRRGTGKWPAYYADSLPSVCDIGLGSPTGVGFGYQSNFPKRWRDSFFIADWSYGRLLSVHLRPDGASYDGSFETFLSGRPLNITDFDFHGGALWFITGGRRTQSALYRVQWEGEQEKPDTFTYDESTQANLRLLRQKLESHHSYSSPEGLKLALQHIDHSDRFIRFSARVALENQPTFKWRKEVLKSKSPDGLLALARVGDPSTQNDLVRAICEILQQGTLDDSTLLTHLRTIQVSISRQGELDNEMLILTHDALTQRYPSISQEVNHELCELLVYLESPRTIDRTLRLIEKSNDTRDLSHYLVFLRYLEDGWSTEERRRYLEALRRFEQFPGGRWYVRTAQDLRSEAIAALTDSEKSQLADLLEPAVPDTPPPPVTVDPANYVKDWAMDDFAGAIPGDLSGRSPAAGTKAYHKAGCAACHRLDSDPSTTHAILGPNLSALGARFDAESILESIIHPSRVIGDKYRNPAGPNVSTMPPGLINGLEATEVLDLLAYLVNQAAP